MGECASNQISLVTNVAKDKKTNKPKLDKVYKKNEEQEFLKIYGFDKKGDKNEKK